MTTGKPQAAGSEIANTVRLGAGDGDGARPALIAGSEDWGRQFGTIRVVEGSGVDDAGGFLEPGLTQWCRLTPSGCLSNDQSAGLEGSFGTHRSGGVTY